MVQKLISGDFEMPSKGNIAEQLKVLRRQYGWLQDDLACEPGVSFSTVNRWENGRTTPNYRAQRAFEQLCKEKNIPEEIL